MCVERKASRTRALEDIVSRMDEAEWAGSITEGGTLAEDAGERAADIVLLDLDLPGPNNPFAAVEILRHKRPTARAIVYSRHVRRNDIERAFAAGAWGFVSKREGATAIAAAIPKVMHDEYVMGPDVEAALMRGN